jgi:hypothetical protein
MAAYAISRQRTLRGMGRTYAFRSMGQDPAAPDIGSPVFAPSPPIFSDAQPAPPPFVYTNPSPVIPAPVITAVAPPNIVGTIPGSGVKFVFPAGGPVPPPGYAIAAAPGPGSSWLSQQMINGVPNSYLALGTVGLVLFLSVSNAKRRR